MSLPARKPAAHTHAHTYGWTSASRQGQVSGSMYERATGAASTLRPMAVSNFGGMEVRLSSQEAVVLEWLASTGRPVQSRYIRRHSLP